MYAHVWELWRVSDDLSGPCSFSCTVAHCTGARFQLHVLCQVAFVCSSIEVLATLEVIVQNINMASTAVAPVAMAAGTSLNAQSGISAAMPGMNFPHGSAEHTDESTGKKKMPATMRLVEQIATPLVESMVATDAISALTQPPAWRFQEDEIEEEEHTLNSAGSESNKYPSQEGSLNLTDMDLNAL